MDTRDVRLGIKLPFYNLFYVFGYPQLLPFSYTFALTYKCNCKCLTCGLHSRKPVLREELSLEEYEKIFRKIGKNIYWVTLTGGEPFLRQDISAIVKALYKICQPKIINIPTNGTLTDIITEGVSNMLGACRKSRIIVNFSLDDSGEKHDHIRGAAGCYNKLSETYQRLKDIRAKSKNFIIGINTVISRHNAGRFFQIYETVKNFAPDSYIIEPVQNRVELMNMAHGFTPDVDEFSAAASYLKENGAPGSGSGMGKTIWKMRMRYYELAGDFLKGSNRMPVCLAGVNSCYVSAYGDIWSCCVRGFPFGNLRQCDYDFNKVWRSPAAVKHRKQIKQDKCTCVLANTFYTNSLGDYKEILRWLIKKTEWHL